MVLGKLEGEGGGGSHSSRIEGSWRGRARGRQHANAQNVGFRRQEDRVCMCAEPHEAARTRTAWRAGLRRVAHAPKKSRLEHGGLPLRAPSPFPLRADSPADPFATVNWPFSFPTLLSANEICRSIIARVRQKGHPDSTRTLARLLEMGF